MRTLLLNSAECSKLSKIISRRLRYI